MALVGTAVKLVEKMKIYPQVLFYVVVLLTTAKKWTKVKSARVGRAKLLFFPLNMQICDFLVAVAVVAA